MPTDTAASEMPVASVIIEPAKVLFLNNAINHGVLTPLGTNEAKESGKSILFLLEANPALADLGPFLPLGQRVVIPAAARRPSTAPMTQLWN